MKTISTFLALFLGLISLNAQNTNPNQDKSQVIIRCGSSLVDTNEPLYVVDGVPLSSKDFLKNIAPEDIETINHLEEKMAIIIYGTLGANGVVIIKTKQFSNNRSAIPKCNTNVLPFKVYCVPNENWVLQQDIYNAIKARVPSLQVENKTPQLERPTLRIRGQKITKVILDGIRYAASVLNALNPEDIESVKIAPSVAAANYFANASNIK